MTRYLLLSVAVISLSMPASAHHGFGRFIMEKDVELKGVLTKLEFVNPHSYVYFNASGDDGKITEMRCEMRAATVLRRSGWSPDLFVKGANIVITGHPHREDPASCYVETLKIGDAPRLERYEQISAAGKAGNKDRPLRLADGTPNIFGDWAQEQYLLITPPGEARGRLVPKSMVEPINKGEVNLADVPGPDWFPRQVTLTEPGREASAALRNLPPDQNPRLNCQISSILFDWTFDGPVNRITQGEGVITIEYGRGLTRTVYMNMDNHPADITPSRGGHSIGSWDGDTLVVDTVGFAPGIVAAIIPNSAAFHVIERFTLEPGKPALKREYVAEDPVYYTDQYKGFDTVLVADAPFAVDQCKELASEYTKD